MATTRALATIVIMYRSFSKLSCEFICDVTIDDVYKYTHRCDMEIETGFQGGWGHIPLQAVKLPISHNNVVGENTVLQLNDFGDWCFHTRGS